MITFVHMKYFYLHNPVLKQPHSTGRRGKSIHHQSFFYVSIVTLTKSYFYYLTSAPNVIFVFICRPSFLGKTRYTRYVHRCETWLPVLPLEEVSLDTARAQLRVSCKHLLMLPAGPSRIVPRLETRGFILLLVEDVLKAVLGPWALAARTLWGTRAGQS